MTYILPSSAHTVRIPHRNIYSQIMDNRKQLSDMQDFINLTGIAQSTKSMHPSNSNTDSDRQA